MKIAILLPGQPRFTGDFTTVLNNLQGYDHADWFCYMTNNSRIDDITPGVQILNSWKSFTVDWAINKLQSNLPPNNYVQAFEISDCEEIEIPSVPRQSHYKGWYNLYKANQLRLEYQKKTGVQYDIVIRVRADGCLNTPLNLKTIDPIQLTNSIIMSENYWEGVNELKSSDQFAISSSDHMTIYAKLVNDVKGYIDENLFNYHPEALLALHLQRNNISTVKGKFTIGLRQHPVEPEKWN
jgi:hypothetical protein